jgi:hypothetical protein
MPGGEVGIAYALTVLCGVLGQEVSIAQDQPIKRTELIRAEIASAIATANYLTCRTELIDPKISEHEKAAASLLRFVAGTLKPHVQP